MNWKAVILAALHAASACESVILVADLGDDRYAVRERATRRLELLDEDALDAVRLGYRSNDCEVHWRCQRILTHYYDVFSEHPDLSIWTLPDKKLAHVYYVEAYNRGIVDDDLNWRDQQAERWAMRNYMADRMDGGLTRREALALVEKLAGNKAEP